MVKEEQRLLGMQEPQEDPECLKNATEAQRVVLQMVAEGRKPAEILAACGSDPSVTKRWVEAVSSPAQRPKCWREALAWLIRQMRPEEIPVCSPAYRLRKLQEIVTKSTADGEGYDPELAMAAMREARLECEHMGLGGARAGRGQGPQINITLVDMLQQRFEEANAKPFCPGLPSPKAVISRAIEAKNGNGTDDPAT